jgi:hypothetical protein
MGQAELAGTDPNRGAGGSSRRGRRAALWPA